MFAFGIFEVLATNEVVEPLTGSRHTLAQVNVEFGFGFTVIGICGGVITHPSDVVMVY